jgi:prepilin signal peptidase PulO-like enzyme (type II secretory pathway)
MSFGFVAIALVYRDLPWYQLGALIVAYQCSVMLAWYDFKHLMLPIWWMAIATLAGVVFGITHYSLSDSILGIVVVAAPLFVLWLISKGRWIGFGDVLLGIAIGVMTGPLLGAAAILLSFWIGAGISLLILIIQRIWKGTLQFSSMIPFGPSMIVAWWLVVLVNIDIWDILQVFQLSNI